MKMLYFFMVSLLIVSCAHTETTTGPVAGKDILEVTELIKIDGLEDELTGVFKGADVYEFIGITSNGIDCLYFPYKDGKFNIEFEALSNEQRPFIAQLKAFAKARGIATTMTTYSKKAYYKSTETNNVIRIDANTNIKNIAAIAKEIESKVFSNDDKTIYDVVPQ